MRLLSTIAAKIGFGGDVYRGKPGARVYAVGDVHGCIDHLDRMLALIEDDVAGYDGAVHLVFLGDLIDRGPDSRGVIDRIMAYRIRSDQPICIVGNHEEFLLRSLEGDAATLAQWLEFGGAECLRSYGGDADYILGKSDHAAAVALRETIPEEHAAFIRGFGDTFRFGDYLFVHAGIRPGLPLDQQDLADLRWIREPFLSYRGNHGFMVVHGHTVTETVDERANRIGIDTGAYRGGSLTALVVEGAERRYLSTGGQLDASLA